ncbi:MAG: type II toxin-antitoxin system Phd/YefM family antitoxin, partial [Nostocoides sp.]
MTPIRCLRASPAQCSPSLPKGHRADPCNTISPKPGLARESGTLGSDHRGTRCSSLALKEHPTAATTQGCTAGHAVNVLVILVTMTRMSLADAKAHLSDVVSRVSKHHERVTVTVHGQPSA